MLDTLHLLQQVRLDQSALHLQQLDIMTAQQAVHVFSPATKEHLQDREHLQSLAAAAKNAAAAAETAFGASMLGHVCAHCATRGPPAQVQCGRIRHRSRAISQQLHPANGAGALGYGNCRL